MSGIRRQFSLQEDRHHGARVIGSRGAASSPTATGVAAGGASVKTTAWLHPLKLSGR